MYNLEFFYSSINSGFVIALHVTRRGAQPDNLLDKTCKTLWKVGENTVYEQFYTVLECNKTLPVSALKCRSLLLKIFRIKLYSIKQTSE